MKKRAKVTLKQVAERADVSPATASMVLNQKEGVSFSPDTVSRVLLAAQALGYPRGAAAMPGALFHRQVIAIFLPTVTGNYYTVMTQAIDQMAHRHGFDTICFETHRNPERELRGVSYLGASDVAGIVFTYVPHNYQQVEEISGRIPVVMIGNCNSDLKLDMVETDNYQSGMQMARHLLELGHRHVAFLATTLAWWGYPSSQRTRGVQDAFAQYPDAELTLLTRPVADTLVVGNTLPSRRIGYELTQACLENPKITGIIAVNDYLGYGVLDALAERGFRVPEDYSVCGCDDIFASSLSGVNLTTINHHLSEKGYSAFDLLHRKITNPKADACEAHPAVSIMRVELLSTLIVRASTGKPRG